jgi:uncharacterized protein DUF1302
MALPAKAATVAVLLMGGLLLGGRAAAQGTPGPSRDVKSALRLDYFSSSRTLDDRLHFVGTSVESRVKQGFWGSLTAVLEARASAFDIGQPTHHAGLTLLEGYLALHRPSFDVRIGRQPISWGRADGINPTDFFTAHDYTLMLPLESDERLAADALRVDYSLTPGQALSLVVAPRFRPNRLPWPEPSPFPLEERRPAVTLANTQWGLRFTRSGTGVDYGLAAFRGWQTMPVLAPLRLEGLPPVFSESYARVYGVGGDVAATLGRFGLRAEAAYVRPDAGAVPPGLGPSWFAVIGSDRSFAERLNVNLQLVVRYAERPLSSEGPPDPLLAVAAFQNAINHGLVHRLNYGTTLRVGLRALHDTLEAECLTYFNFDPSNYMVRPMVTYALSDRVKLIGDFTYYGGPEATFFGRLKGNRSALLEVRYSF